MHIVIEPDRTCILNRIFYLAYSRLSTEFVPRKSKASADLAAIGQRIRQLRGSERQDDFAPALGITQGQLSKIERGLLAPSVDVLVRLGRRSKKSVDWILTGEHF